jgi:O-acetyl-ADP-ribose deacetylase
VYISVLHIRLQILAMSGLGQAALGLNVLNQYALRPGVLFCVSSGNITTFTGDAIVNAANRAGLGGGGVDGAITRAGGVGMAEERKALPLVKAGIRIPTGDARTTSSGSMPSRFCIHAVGPCYHNVDETNGDQLLAGAYSASMREAKANGVKTLAFSMISAGAFRANQPLSKILDISIRTIAGNVYPGLESVYMIGFTEKEVDALNEVAREIF